MTNALDYFHFPIEQYNTADFWRVLRKAIREEVKTAIVEDRNEQAMVEWKLTLKRSEAMDKRQEERIERLKERDARRTAYDGDQFAE